MEQHSAGCLCGAVRVEATGAPDRVGICHCTDCKRHHGALFFAAAIFPQEAVRIFGAPRSYAGRFFCAICGSSVFARSGTEVEIHLGALNDATGLIPSYELWTERRAAWLPAFPGVESHPRNRPDPAKPGAA